MTITNLSVRPALLPPIPVQLFLPPPPPPALTIVPGIGAVVGGSAHTRPLWFDGRFLTASDLQTEQQYFVDRQARLGKAGGLGEVHGLTVDPGPDNETIVIHAGNGITPGGRLVMLSGDLTIRLSDLPEEENLNVQFGLSGTPRQPARTRTGLYVIALRPVEFTANPIATYPANLAAPRVARDGDVVEATAAALVPYPNPVSSFDASIVQAALARQIFVTGDAGGLVDSLLPLAMISVDRDVIQWIDPYLARRDSGPPGAAAFDTSNPATQRAFLLQYDQRLQAVVGGLSSNASFAASNHFQALPAAGRFPFSCIDTTHMTQAYFPQQMDVTLALVPADELPALIEESLSLPPIDLTLPAASYANLSIYALAPVARNDFAGLQASCPNAPLQPAVLPPLSTRPLPGLALLAGRLKAIGSSSGSGSGWPALPQPLAFGFYIRRRSEPVFAAFSFPPPVTTTTAAPATTPAPTTTPGPTTTNA